jgi:selenocysteine lyase/cysteine desulfurase
VTFKHLFNRFLTAEPNRLHFAAHSHHPWPDVSYEAQIRYWEDSARLMDDKWDLVFGELIPDLRRRIALILVLPDPNTLVFAPNTHELITRVFSCLRPPVRIVTTDAEFHSFNRQARRWEQAGLAAVTRIAAEPFDTFRQRMAEAVDQADLVYLSEVFFDSGYVVTDLSTVIGDSPKHAFVVIDGYHAFMARPVDLSTIADRVFYIAGGYKYAMSGEGACFMHCPPGYGERPIDTGWFAGFSDLFGRGDDVPYGSGGDRFWGATFDPSGLYRMQAVLKMLEGEGLGPASIHAHAASLQQQFLSADIARWELIPAPDQPRGNFLTFRTPEAEAIYERLHTARVITDFRGDRWRVGFGIYHDPAEVDRLVKLLQ